MTNKMVLIGIAILAVGLIALPQTFALFAGQHYWYDVNNNGADNYGIPCMKCHSDIQAELDLSAGDGTGPHNSVVCADCHITALVDMRGGVVGGSVALGDNIHAAGLPACMDCHSANTSDTSTAPDATTILEGSLEVHKDFAKNASNTGNILVDENEACVACHTHVAVDINWQKAYKMSFVARESGTVGNHAWVVSNFVTEGTVLIDTYGNRDGTNYNYTEYNINVTGIDHLNEWYNASNP